MNNKLFPDKQGIISRTISPAFENWSVLFMTESWWKNSQITLKSFHCQFFSIIQEILFIYNRFSRNIRLYINSVPDMKDFNAKITPKEKNVFQEMGKHLLIFIICFYFFSQIFFSYFTGCGVNIYPLSKQIETGFFVKIVSNIA